jgi:hypothetical protein
VFSVSFGAKESLPTLRAALNISLKFQKIQWASAFQHVQRWDGIDMRLRKQRLWCDSVFSQESRLDNWVLTSWRSPPPVSKPALRVAVGICVLQHWRLRRVRRWAGRQSTRHRDRSVQPYRAYHMTERQSLEGSQAAAVSHVSISVSRRYRRVR